jgi:NIMA (never in mitosis gene a)-related kinase 1/4/5
VERKSDGKIYALKRVNISKMSKREVQDAVNEIRILASVRHPHIVSFLQAFLDKNGSELCIIMEYCGCGDLAQKVDRYKQRKQQVDERVLWAYLIQVCV